MSKKSANTLPDNAIEIRGLNKTYKATGKAGPKEALKDINLDIPRGSIFGLLGPNGAGKSTIINIMSGLVTKTSGTVRIWDYDIDHAMRSAKTAIGIVPQEINQDWFFTPRQVLNICAGMYGVPKAERRTDEILKMIELSDKADAWARSLSGGMKRRLMIGKAMVHTPPILVLDEPTAGVDVELRKQLWDNIRKLNDQGVTIVLTTHYLEEAEELCDRIAIINHGKIVACEDKEDLIQRIDAKEVRFRLNKAITSISKPLKALGAKKEGRRTLMMRYTPKDIEMGEIIAHIQKAKYGIVDISTDDSDLEDIFIQLTRDKVA